MPYLHQSRWQDMLKKTANELHGINSGLASPTAFDLSPAECDHAIAMTEDTTVGYSHAEYVS